MQSVLSECSNVNTEGNGGIVSLGVYIMRVLICNGGKGPFWIDGNQLPDDGVMEPVKRIGSLVDGFVEIVSVG